MTCLACKTVKRGCELPETVTPQRSLPQQQQSQSGQGSQALAVPHNARMARSPSPRHGSSSSGAIPKVKLQIILIK